MDEKLERRKEGWEKFIDASSDLKYWKVTAVVLSRAPSLKSEGITVIRARSKEDAIKVAKSEFPFFHIIRTEEVEASEYILAKIAKIDAKTQHIEAIYLMVACIVILTIISVIATLIIFF